MEDTRRHYVSENYRFRFGKYKGRTALDVYNDGIYGKSYIFWAYYHMEDLDFADKWIQQIGIELVKKPGVYPEVYERMMQKHFTEEEREQIACHREKTRMGKWSHSQRIQRERQIERYERILEIEKRQNSKAALAWKNQGH